MFVVGIGAILSPLAATNNRCFCPRTNTTVRRLRRCRFSCRLAPTLSGIEKGEQRQITLSVDDLKTSCRTSYSPSVA